MFLIRNAYSPDHVQHGVIVQNLDFFGQYSRVKIVFVVSFITKYHKLGITLDGWGIIKTITDRESTTKVKTVQSYLTHLILLHVTKTENGTIMLLRPGKISFIVITIF